MNKKWTPALMVAAATTLFFWASAFVGIKESIRDYSPMGLALSRFLIASVAIGFVCIFAKIRKPDVRDLPPIFGIGLIGIVVYHVALNFGEMHVTAASASFLIGSAPVFTTLLAAFFLGERLSSTAWLGIAVSILGVGLISLGESSGFEIDRWSLSVLAAAVAMGIYFVWQKPFLKKYSALEFTAYTIWAGTLLMTPFLPWLPDEIGRAQATSTLAVVWLGLFPSALAYVAWTYVMSRLTASSATTLLYIVPALALFMGWVWLGELPAPVSLLGGLFALTGVIMVHGGSIRNLIGAKLPNVQIIGKRIFPQTKLTSNEFKKSEMKNDPNRSRFPVNLPADRIV